MSLNVDRLTFATTIVTPLAQITVVDANEGDSNIVDWCQFPLGQSNSGPVYKDKSWRRVIIDTGPGGSKVGADQRVPPNITNTLVGLTSKLRIPALAGGPVSNVDPPSLDELQITHLDDDHVGNAAAFLTNMLATNAALITKSTVTYSPIPALFVVPKIEPTTIGTGSDLQSNRTNFVIFRASIDKQWKTAMEAAGFIVDLEFSVDDDSLEWNFKNDFAQWDSDTLEDVETEVRTLTWYEQAKNAKLSVALKAQVWIWLQSTNPLATTLKKVKRTWTASTTMAKTLLKGSSSTLRLSAQQWTKLAYPYKYTINSWTDGGKRKKNASAVLDKLMSNMTLTSPPKATLSPAYLDDPGSVAQISDLGVTIRTLNATKKTLMLESLYPAADQTHYENPLVPNAATIQGMQYQCIQRYIGPSPDLYKDLMRQIMLNRYELDQHNLLDVGRNDVDGITANRSSIVTMFHRKDAPFSMLFTGDAFDSECDIRDTLLSWDKFQGGTTTMQVDVLKVPHHGSNATTMSGFYAYCRAYVYIISGCHQNSYGNPKPSSIEAIVRGFKDQKTPDGKPFYLFFSNPLADKDYTYTTQGKKTPPVKHFRRSAALAMLQNDDLKPSTDYNYKMFKLTTVIPLLPDDRKQTPPANQAFSNFGGILLGKNSSGQLVTSWDPTRWTEMTLT